MGYNYTYHYYHSSIPYEPKVGFGVFGGPNKDPTYYLGYYNQR